MRVYQSKADVAYITLRSEILDGTLAPGSLLNQEQVANDLGVSTTPVREALRRLESEGLVLMPAHRDVMVAPLDLDGFSALHEVREELDTMAAGLAARRYDDDDRAAMLSTAEAVDRRADDPIRAYRDFHAAIYHASHDDVLIGCLERLWDRSDRYRRAISDFASDADSTPSPLDLVDAVLSRDSQRSEALMREYLAQVQAQIHASLKRFRDTTLAG